MDAIDVVWLVIGILVAIVLVLRIAQMTGATVTTVHTVRGHTDGQGGFYPAQPAVPVLPDRTAAELTRLIESMPTEWVTYDGVTPPLKLKIRGTTEDIYVQACRKYIEQLGQQAATQLSPHQMAIMRISVNAENYVLDWEGARYPNGNPVPFSISGLFQMLQSDPFLDSFLSDQVQRISPK